MLMAAATALLGWVVHHSEPTFADGLRYIHQAERIELAKEGRAAWSMASTIHSIRWVSRPPTA